MLLRSGKQINKLDVCYPTTDNEQKPTDAKSVRSLRIKTPTEINKVVKDIKNVVKIKKCVPEVRDSVVRQTRRNKHNVEHIPTDGDVDNDAIKISKALKNKPRSKGKTINSKKENIKNVTQNKTSKKNSKTSIKVKSSNSSLDSLHSAAGGPNNNNIKDFSTKSKPKKTNTLASGSTRLKKRSTSHVEDEGCKRDVNEITDLSIIDLSDDSDLSTENIFIQYPVKNTQRNNNIIKSSMKGSNQSFVLEEKSATKPASCQKEPGGGAGQSSVVARAKRSRLTNGLQQTVDRLSHPRTSSAHEPQTATKETDRKSQPPSLIKTYGKKSYTIQFNLEVSPFSIPSKIPVKENGGVVVNEIKKVQPLINAVRKDEAKQMIMRKKPATVLIENRNIKMDENKPHSSTNETDRKLQSPSLIETGRKKTNSWFGYNMVFNPFSIPSKNVNKIKNVQLINSELKDLSKEMIMRKTPATVVIEKRNENRSTLKDLRTNRRFELQMKTRNING